MILSELIDRPVHGGGAPVGSVIDARFLLDETSTDQPTPPARLYGLVVSPHKRSSFLGYERSSVRSPWPLASLLRRRQRGAFLVLWDDIAELATDRVVLRPGFRRWSPELDRSAAVPPELH